jgi:hypothetical protein
MKTKGFLLIICLLTQSLHAQYADSIRVAHHTNFTYKQLYVPGALMLSGSLLSLSADAFIKEDIADWRNEHIPNFSTTADNYLMFAPIVIAYGLDAFGVKSNTDIVNRTVILAKGELLFLASSQLLKLAVDEQRPDGSDYKSFPSGHTMQAFLAATFLSEEYKEELPWIPYLAYGIASSVGVLRIANNKHYINDVLFGAGAGILCMKVSYWTHQYKWGKKKSISKPIAWY